MKPRVAGAPISWGVCEVPGWGYQMEAEKVLDEVARLGITALEAGPEGFLPGEPKEMVNLLSEHGLELVGGFLPVVLHRPGEREPELASVERQAGLFAAAGADVLVIAATTGEEGYEESAGLEDNEWDELFATLAMVEEIGAKHGLSVVLHPHYGTEIESPEHGLIVKARVVRSDVSQVGSLGVRYVAAAVFERPFEILDPQGSRREAEPSHFSLAMA